MAHGALLGFWSEAGFTCEEGAFDSSGLRLPQHTAIVKPRQPCFVGVSKRRVPHGFLLRTSSLPHHHHCCCCAPAATPPTRNTHTRPLRHKGI